MIGEVVTAAAVAIAPGPLQSLSASEATASAALTPPPPPPPVVQGGVRVALKHWLKGRAPVPPNPKFITTPRGIYRPGGLRGGRVNWHPGAGGGGKYPCFRAAGVSCFPGEDLWFSGNPSNDEAVFLDLSRAPTPWAHRPGGAFLGPRGTLVCRFLAKVFVAPQEP